MRTGLIVFGLIGLLIIFGAAATTLPTTAAPARTSMPVATEGPIEPTATERPIEPTATATRYLTMPPTVKVDVQRAASEPIGRTATPTTTVSIKATSALKPTALPRPMATSFPVTPGVVNAVAVDQFLVMPADVQQTMRDVFARGQTLGRKPRSFSTAGDSTIETPYFLGPFGTDKYNLGGYNYLQPTIDFFAGSFGRDSVAVRIGQHSWSVLNPVWADKKRCEPNESPLACEFRLNQPSVLIIRLGVNDSGVPKMFDTNLRKIVDYAIEQGVIPILSTKPDQRAGTEVINDLVKQIAAEYKLPLWDYEQVAKTLPGRGLGSDGAHMTSFWQNDYR
ncbi:MAG TPA: SGNH/GDSL hydrolase family protein, partial [Anaerolineae bacterium]|nr:SGNH/GDSL hydrolase family protein [Anaerolineae bacterium]